MHAVEFLKQTERDIPPVTVLWGAQRYLKQSCLTALKRQVIQEDDTSLTTFDGREIDLQTVTDELRTVSMWSDRRLVVVDEADDFVTNYRGPLEKYFDKPAKKSVLVLSVKTWAKTTRLAKQLAASGLDLECSQLKGDVLSKWLQDTARDNYHQALSRDAAYLLMELVGDELGMLDQELSKLSTYVGAGGKIGADEVRKLVGGWKTETTWKMTDAVRDGQLNSALEALDQLINSGEAGLKLLGGIAFVFKKFAQATDLSHSGGLDQALRQAGVFPSAVSQSVTYLRRLGRPRAEQILNRLLAADAGIKGANSLPERIQLEKLLVELSGQV